MIKINISEPIKKFTNLDSVTYNSFIRHNDKIYYFPDQAMSVNSNLFVLEFTENNTVLTQLNYKTSVEVISDKINISIS